MREEKLMAITFFQAKIERMNILNIILRTERLDVSVLNIHNIQVMITKEGKINNENLDTYNPMLWHGNQIALYRLKFSLSRQQNSVNTNKTPIVGNLGFHTVKLFCFLS